MKKKIHLSWIFGWSAFGVLMGIVFCLRWPDYFGHISWLVIGLSFIFITFINRRASLILLAVVGGVLIGLWRGSLDLQSQNVYQAYIDKQVQVSGIVSEDVAFGRDGKQQIKLKEVELEGARPSGQLWVSTYSPLEIKRSDKLELSGRLGEGFGNFPAAMNKAEIMKVTKIKHGDVGRELRDWFGGHVRKVIEEPEASLGIGFLTGQHSTLPESLNNNLKILGLTHIIVASGYNLTILVRFARGALAGISKYLATLGSSMLIISFILITGASPSMTRAGLITGLSLLAWYYGRRIHPLVLLPFSAAITALVNPSYLWGDLGWYLSFAAFSGVILLAPLLAGYFWGKQKPNAIARVLIETGSAQILTMPIIAFAFGQYAPLALPANMLILPLIPLAMAFVFISGLSAIIFAKIAAVVSLPAQWVLDYMTFITDKLSGLPISQGSITFSSTYLVVSYMLIILLMVWLWRRTRHDFAEDSIIE